MDSLFVRMLSEPTPRPHTLPAAVLRYVTGNVTRFNCYHNRWIMDVDNLTLVVAARGKRTGKSLHRVFPGMTRVLLMVDSKNRAAFTKLTRFEGPPRSSAFMVGMDDYKHAAYGHISKPKRREPKNPPAVKQRRKVKDATVDSDSLKLYVSRMLVRGETGAFVVRDVDCKFTR